MSKRFSALQLHLLFSDYCSREKYCQSFAFLNIYLHAKKKEWFNSWFSHCCLTNNPSVLIHLNNNKNNIQRAPLTKLLWRSGYSNLLLKEIIDCCIKDTHSEKALSNKTPALTKSTNMGVWAVSTKMNYL